MVTNLPTIVGIKNNIKMYIMMIKNVTHAIQYNV